MAKVAKVAKEAREEVEVLEEWKWSGSRGWSKSNVSVR